MSYERINYNNPEITEARERCLANIKTFEFAKPSNMWAYKLLTRHGNGEHIPPDHLRMAQEAVKHGN